MGRGWCGRSARSKASTQIALIGRVRFRRLRGLLLTQRSFRAVQRWSVGFFAQTGESESCDAPDICQSKMASGDSGDQMSETRKVAVGYARGIIGGMLIGVPSMMTMEMWWEGFFVPAPRLLLLFAVNFGVLFILQHYSGLTHKKTI